jgi:hypothetical protein
MNDIQTHNTNQACIILARTLSFIPQGDAKGSLSIYLRGVFLGWLWCLEGEFCARTQCLICNARIP